MYRLRNIRFLRFAVAMLLAVVPLWGCSLDDDRDVCCDNLRMEFRYVPYGIEELPTYIHRMRHFVFDASDRFVCELPSGPDLRLLRFKLPPGEYTMLTVGNLESRMEFRSGDRSLKTLEMELLEFTESGNCRNSDELYWGFCRFRVVRGPAQRFVTYMNNIHCHLHIKVLWHNMPEYVGDYRMELQDIPRGYRLDPSQSRAVSDKVVPAINGRLCTHELEVPLRSQELRAEFVTLRYTSDYIPVFRLWFGDRAVTGPIDLRRAFRTWGWNPDATAVQEYRIQLTLFSDGAVEVRPWIDADVEDWQNGGTFG